MGAPQGIGYRVTVALSPPTSAGLSGQLISFQLQAAANAITELDLAQAEKLLKNIDLDLPAVAFERARLALYQGDCEAASAILSAPSLRESEDGKMMSAVAKTCAGATAGAVVAEDNARGIWIRLQDPADRVLVPYLVTVAAQARDALARDLGINLPRPLRIDLVRDLFSLSAVSGLPLSAAETTGTVGVARWGKIILVSPRATPFGYPWEDTLAHELTHLVLTRASRDRAPLWLQEGVAKRHETRWREERPFDHRRSYDEVARTALIQGTAIGIDQLGPSIALLPTPEAASIAYAEVASFVDFWVDHLGPPTLRLLLLDLRNSPSDDPNTAMRSVTGFNLSYWNELWKRELLSHHPSQGNDADTHPPAVPVTVRSLRQAGAARGATEAKNQARSPIVEQARAARLSDLLSERGYNAEAGQELASIDPARSRDGSLRWRWARQSLAQGDPKAAEQRLGDLSQIDGPFGGWVGLLIRLAGDAKSREAARSLATALDPLSEDVACDGEFRTRRQGSREFLDAPEPKDPGRRDLCRAARQIPRD